MVRLRVIVRLRTLVKYRYISNTNALCFYSNTWSLQYTTSGLSLLIRLKRLIASPYLQTYDMWVVMISDTNVIRSRIYCVLKTLLSFLLIPPLVKWIVCVKLSIVLFNYLTRITICIARCKTFVACYAPICVAGCMLCTLQAPWTSHRSLIAYDFYQIWIIQDFDIKCCPYRNTGF